MSLASGFVRAVRRPWVRRAALGVAALFVLFGLFGYLALPGIIKSQAEKAVTAALHRKFTIERVAVRPYSLAITVQGVKLYEPDGQAVFASFQELQARISTSSLIHLAPVVKEVSLHGPFVHLARTGANRYSTDDIVAALSSRSQPPAKAPPPQAGGAARFSVYNIRVDGGRVEFDDQPAHAHHTVADLSIGIPFVSSLPSQEEVFVEPLLSAVINGAPLLIKGKARPFAETREAVVDLDLDRVELPKYLQYLPFEPRFKMPRATLDLYLRASFQQPKDRSATVILSGKAALKSLQLTTLDGAPILALPEFVVELGKADLLARRVEVSRVAATGLDLNVIKDSRGRLNLELLAPPEPGDPQAQPAASVDHATSAPAGPALQVAIGQIALQDGSFRFSDRTADRSLEAAVEQFDLRISDTALDLQARHLTIGQIDSASARFRVQQGRKEGERSGGSTPPDVAAASFAKASEAKAASARASEALAKEPPWTASVGQVSVGNWAARIESRGLPQIAVTAVTAIAITGESLSNAGGSAPGKIGLRAKVNRNGALWVTGALGLAPLHADVALDLNGVDLLALQPYFTERVNLLITQADLSTRGRLVLDQNPDGSFKGGFRGNAMLGNLATIDKLNSNDFLNWKSLSFGGVDARLEPFSLNIDQIALTDFFARVIIDPAGRINLQDIVRSGGEARSLTSDQPAQSDQAPALTPTPLPQAAEGTKSTAAVPISIREVRLQGGRVRYTDNFIKPNYTANLVDLAGTVGGLSSQADTTAAVDLHGEVNNAPLTIAGRINPIKGDLFLDLKAGVHGMELAPLSPYSGKYVGYGIEQGKLSFDVAYKLEHRQLNAENRLVLDQLTFGDKVDSPTATTLPVQLAVALLKDRNGVIDIDLPIGGSLDDPQFSVGAVIVKVVVNLITKAVTAPFALLGSLFGGGDELSFIEYAPGSVDAAPAGQSRLQALATALQERPALNLEITAWVDADSDREGLRRESLDRRVRAMKVKDLVAKGESATVADVPISPEEYPVLLGRLYAVDKPAKSASAPGAQQAPADIEKLLLASTLIRDEELTALGDQRSQAVKQWLQTTGQVPEERLFLRATRVGPGADPPGQSSAKSSRVEFSLK
jgi:hypothetical protein